MTFRALTLSALLLLVCAAPALAATARDLSSNIRIDGFADDFAIDEAIFGYNEIVGAPEEPWDDSKWGSNEDLNQIYITWDAKNLYIAATGVIWNNNMVVLLDVINGRGLESMVAINSWRRNFQFDTVGSALGNGFAPDLFGATWDGNTQPHLIVQLDGNRVDDQVVGPTFRASASFSQGNLGRAMEFAIPWQSVFLASAGLGTKDTLMTVGGITDTLHFFPPGTKIRIAGVITAGGDGTSGPDIAPDNLGGTTDNSSALVFVDNWAIVDLDLLDDTGLGNGGPDGIADWDVSPKLRTSFRVRPPFLSKQFSASQITFDRPAFRPDAGERIRFSFQLDQPVNPNDPADANRVFGITAKIFDVRGRLVRTVVDPTRSALDPTNESIDQWDGRDDAGQIVAAGIYVLRLTVTGSTKRATRSFVVVR
ncbi:MAG: hypothetical protein IT348_09475 [Candidatus Eisenbacteria bacterium]|nr:hypothetical protein [Candidatus Eisenbacteria bacterium]